MPNKTDPVGEILGAFAEEIINYDKRMEAAGAPPIRFVGKYAKEARQALLDAVLEVVIRVESSNPYDKGAHKSCAQLRQQFTTLFMGEEKKS